MPRLAAPSFKRDVLRAPTEGMVGPDDPKAERLKQRKGKRNMTRATFGGVFKLLIHGTTPPPDPISEDCEKCLALTARPNAGLSF